MTERKLPRRSFSLVRDVETCQEMFFTEAKANNESEETEIDGGIVELHEEVNSVTDRQVKGHSDSNNTVVMSANSVTDRQVKGHSDSSNTVVMSASCDTDGQVKGHSDSRNNVVMSPNSVTDR